VDFSVVDLLARSVLSLRLMMTTYHKPSATAVNIVGYSYASIVADAIANGLANDPGYQFTCNSEAFIYDNDLTGS
jgi:hypothetical protein